jgi:hypothetical protein
MRPQRIGAMAVLVAALAATVVFAGSTAGAPRPIREARRTALRDVYRRLERLRLPPQARPVKTVGRGLHLNGAGSIPDTPNLVQMHSYFLSPQPREAVVAWLRSHPPVSTGMRESGSLGIGKKTVVKYLGFEYPEERGRVRERQISFAVAARPGGGSAFRIDSQAVWITPRTAAGTIPAGARLIDVKVWKLGKLRRSKVISDPAEVRSIADLIDGFEVTQPGTYSCPELGTVEKRLDLTFRHRRRGPVLAEVEQEVPPGCGRALKLTIHAHKPQYLEEGGLLLERLRPILAGGAKGSASR